MKTIICDRCECENCTVSEVLPPSEKLTMAQVAGSGKSPYRFDDCYQQSQRNRKWKISCADCGHSVEYTEYHHQPVPMFAVGS